MGGKEEERGRPRRRDRRSYFRFGTEYPPPPPLPPADTVYENPGAPLNERLSPGVHV